MIVDGARMGAGKKVDLRDAELEPRLDVPQVLFAHSNLDPVSASPAASSAESPLPVALLRGTDLSGADLRGADLTRADLDGAILLGADLTGAELGDASLRGVIADNTTTWPAGFTPPKAEA